MKNQSKKTKPVAYQAIIIENYSDGTFDVRMEAGRLEGGRYIPEIRKHGGETRCDVRQAAQLTVKAAERIEAALLDAAAAGVNHG